MIDRYITKPISVLTWRKCWSVIIRSPVRFLVIVGIKNIVGLRRHVSRQGHRFGSDIIVLIIWISPAVVVFFIAVSTTVIVRCEYSRAVIIVVCCIFSIFTYCTAVVSTALSQPLVPGVDCGRFTHLRVRFRRWFPDGEDPHFTTVALPDIDNVS